MQNCSHHEVLQSHASFLAILRPSCLGGESVQLCTDGTPKRCLAGKLGRLTSRHFPQRPVLDPAGPPGRGFSLAPLCEGKAHDAAGDAGRIASMSHARVFVAVGIVLMELDKKAVGGGEESVGQEQDKMSRLSEPVGRADT